MSNPERGDFDSGRKDSEVGAVAVLCDPKYHAVLQDVDITNYDFHELIPFSKLMHKTKLSFTQLRDIGKAAKREGKGINNHPNKIMIQLHENIFTPGYRALDNNSGMKDGTASKIVLCPQRFLMGPKQGYNTCSQDIMFWVALQLLVGLVQRDQLYPAEFQKLPKPAQRLYLNSLTPWGTEKYADQDAMHTARDGLCHALDDHTSDQKGSYLGQGELHDFNEVLISAVENIPQFSWSQVSAVHCCNNLKSEPRDITTMSVLSVLLSNEVSTVEDHIRLHFAHRPAAAHQSCKRDGCKQKPLYFHAGVVDCLPLTLAVDLGHGITAAQRPSRQPFKDISLEYRHFNKTTGNRETASYAVKGAVFRLATSNFIARWLWTHGDSRCVHEYNGTRDGWEQHEDNSTLGDGKYVTELGNVDLFPGAEADAACVTIFYRRTDHKSPPK